jgi:predicted 2-oxoglutarate/Fe(II)-dependent dioxygenase YbiX
MTDYLIFEDVLGDEQNREIYRLALSKRELFAGSRTSPNRLYPDWRRSTVIYDCELAAVASRIEHEIKSRLPHAVRSLGIPAFDADSMEIQLTSHNDGDYYHWHTDNGSRETSSRALTFVYYFHCLPKAFSGGELVIYMQNGESAAIEPRNDSLVLFSSSMKHEVRPVSCPSKRFADGRFTLNGWLRRATAQRDDYFDRKIFSFPSHLRPAPGRASPGKASSVPTPNASAPAPSHSHTGGTALQTPDAGTRALALLEVYSDLFRQSRQARAVEVRSDLPGDEFYERYYFANRPVLLKGVMKDSPAVRSWSPEFLAARHGSVPVTVTADRGRHSDYESNFAETVRTVSLRELVKRIEVEPESNDYYLVARNFFFDQPALRPLRHDLWPPSDIIDHDDGRPGTVKMWFGPKGTVTPLHHDEHSILFAQIFGRKRFKLIPPFDGPHLYVRRRFYSAIDPETVDLARYPEFSRATVLDVVAEPGDMVFLPVGWWHWVKALDVSISTTFCSFRVEGRNTSLRIPRE